MNDKFKISPYREKNKFKEEYGIKITKSKVRKLVSSLTENKVMLFMQNY